MGLALTELKAEDVPHRMYLLAGQVYSACGMRGWCFGLDRKLIFSTSANQNELLTFLGISGCLSYAYEYFLSSHRPFILSDKVGLMWLGEFSHDEQNSPKLLYLLGPVFLSHASVHSLESALAEMNLSVAMRSGMVHILQRIPVVPLSMFIQYALMLHFTITEEVIRPSDVNYQPAGRGTSGGSSEISRHNLDFMNNDMVRSVEQILLQHVRDGNPNYYRVWEQVVGFKDADSPSQETPLRETKDTFLIFTALCARAAIEGGLSPLTAKNLENHYIGLIEKADTLQDVASAHRAMMDDFVRRVGNCKASQQFSPTVNQCFAYINENLLRDFSLADMARAIGYTEYYLTKKFYKETGIRLIDTIKDARIEHAKIWLLTTGKSIQDISDQMNFGSRRYFSKIFLERTGMTPADFRNKIRGVAT